MKKLFLFCGLIFCGRISHAAGEKATALMISTGVLSNQATYFYQNASALNLRVGASTVAVCAPTGTSILGTTTNNNAVAGYYGEYVSSAINSGNFQTSGTYGDAASITLTAGDWGISGLVLMDNNTSSTITNFIMGISTTSGNFFNDSSLGQNRGDFAGGAAGWQLTLTVPDYRVSLSTTITYYLKYLATYASGQPKASGRISARRIR